MGEATEQTIFDKVSRKIGIKLLDNTQIETLFPEYNRMLKMIDEQRNRISSGGEYVTNERYHLMHDNILGIFGSRGSGKTSIIFSLWEKMIKNQKYDIILPIISPELIVDNCSILLLVLSMLENNVKNLNKYLQNNDDCMYKFLYNFNLSKRDCDIYKHNSVFWEEYQTLLSTCNNTYSSLDSYSYDETIEIQKYVSGIQYKLMNRLNKFWDMLIFIQKHKNSENKQPLLFIIFDDIDLAPERSMELVLSSYKYFSNPNICIILSAALKTLKQVLTCRVYEKAIGSNFRSLIQNNYLRNNNNLIDVYGIERASEAATEYLNKVIPQSSRFILTNFDTIDKKQMFRYPLDFNTEYDPSNNLSIPLDELLIKTLNESGFLNKTCLDNEPYENFFERDNNFAKEYYLLFGNKSRYINNACLSIINTIFSLAELKNEMQEEINKNQSKKFEDSKKYIRKIYNILNNLLLSLISSHTRELDKYTSWIPELLKYNRGEHYLFVDYVFLNNQYKIEVENIKKDLIETLKDIQEYMTKNELESYKNNFLSDKIVILRKKIAVLFIILNFIEQLICILSPLYYTMLGYEGRERKIHGYEQLMQFINQGNIINFENFELNIYPNIPMEMKDILNIYIDILEAPERFIKFSIYDAECVSDYFSYLNDKPLLNKKLDVSIVNNNCEIIRSCNDYSDWIKTICYMLYLNKSGIQLLQGDFFQNTNEFFNDIASISQLNGIKNLYIKQLYKFIDSWNLKEKAESLYKDIFNKRNINNNIEYTWDEILNIFNDSDIDKNYSNILSYSNNIGLNFIMNNLNYDYRLDFNEYSKKVNDLFEELYLKLVRNIPKLPLEFRIKGSKINSALDAIFGLSSISDQVRLEIKEIEDIISNFASQLFELKQKIEMFEQKEDESNQSMQELASLNKLYKNKLEEFIILDFYKIFRMSSRVSIVLNSLVDDEVNNFFGYNSLLSLFDSMEIVSFDNEDNKGYLKELLTFIGLIPYYIAAQFYLKNDKQYFEYSVKTKDDIENSKNSVSKRDYPAEKYSEIVEKISPSDGSKPDDMYNVLFKTLVDIKNKYIRDKMRKFGVIIE